MSDGVPMHAAERWSGRRRLAVLVVLTVAIWAIVVGFASEAISMLVVTMPAESGTLEAQAV